MENLMKYLIFVAVLASTSLAAFSQTTCTVGSAIGKVAKAASARSAVSGPSMLDMTLPEFRAAVAKTDIVLLPIGSIEEHGPNLPLGTYSLLAVAQLVVALSEIAGDAGAPFAAVTSGLPTVRELMATSA
jgi:hypothetical protein